MKPASDASAREKLLFHLKTRGPQSAAEMARKLGVTTMAVRQHLQKLSDEGLVDYTDRRQKVGRPLRMWRLTEASSQRFPDTHADLTVEIIDAVRKSFGEDGLAKVIDARTRDQERDYKRRMPPRSASLADRVDALARIRRDEGYMAEVRRERDGSLLLIENHCPICAAARVCQGLCRDELALFRRLLGRRAHVERTEHVLADARRCVYAISGA